MLSVGINVCFVPITDMRHYVLGDYILEASG